MFFVQPLIKQGNQLVVIYFVPLVWQKSQSGGSLFDHCLDNDACQLVGNCPTAVAVAYN